MREKEAKIVNIESPGKGFWEQVEIENKSVYAKYNPPTDLREAVNKHLVAEGKDALPVEIVSIENFMPGDPNPDFIIQNVPLKRCPWPLAGEPVKPEPDLWNRVKAFVMNHAELPDDRLYDLHVAWIYATWIPEAFQAVPYLWYLGPKQSGKTRCLEILQALCYRGFLSPSVTDATLYRLVDRWTPTLLLDEAEVYGREERSTIQNLLNAGYRRGQVIPRMLPSNNGYDLELFEVFGFKAISSTRGFKGTLESRCIPVNMERNSAPVSLFIDEAEAKAIRSQLLYWRFRRLVDVLDILDILPKVPPPELNFTNGRFTELYAPLITVANEGKDNIVSYAREQWSLISDEEKLTEEATITQALIDSQPLVENGFIPTLIITENYNKGLTESDQLDNKRIGWIMKRLGFNKRKSKGARGWVFDDRRVDRLAMRYGVGTPEKTSKTSKTSIDNSEEYGEFMERRQENFDKLAEATTP